MKALILGTDFLKDSDGNLRILETNTNVDVHNKIVPDLDWVAFKQLLIDNSIDSLHFIATDGNFIATERDNPFDTTTPSISLKDSMQEIMNDISGTFNYYEVAKNSITVPYIEDAPNKLIIRTSYDTTAVVDEEYTKDKVNFHKLIQNESYCPNVYYSSSVDTNFNIDQLTTLHTTSDDAPNYIVKTRYPNTDYFTYPKFYKIESLENLESLKNSLTELEYMEEFHTHTENIVNEKMGVIRSLDILYGSNLNCLHLGSYIMTSPIKTNAWETTYNENGLMAQNARSLWMSKSPKGPGGIAYILDNDTKILYNDNSLKYPSEILENDNLKTLLFSWVPENESGPNNEPLFIPNVNSGSFVIDSENLTIASSSVVNIGSETKESLMIRVTLENGIIYEDLPGSAMMLEEYDTLRTTFCFTNKFRVNDSVIMFDYVNNQLLKTKIIDLDIVYVNKQIYDIDVETNDVFLPVASESLGLTFIQHNACYGWCYGGACPYWSCNSCYFCSGPGPQK